MTLVGSAVTLVTENAATILTIGQLIGNQLPTVLIIN